MDGFWLLSFPFPPSDNNLFDNAHGFGRVKAPAYKSYKKEVDGWAWTNIKEIRALRKYCELKPLLNISILLKAPREKFWTKKGTVKKMDAANTLKAPMDCLSELIDLDDSHFWSVSIQKVVGEKECLDIFIQTARAS